MKYSVPIFSSSSVQDEPPGVERMLGSNPARVFVLLTLVCLASLYPLNHLASVSPSTCCALSGFHNVVFHYPFSHQVLNASLSSTLELYNMSLLGFNGILTTAPYWNLSTPDAMRYAKFLHYASVLYGFTVFGVTLEDPAFVSRSDYLNISMGKINQDISQSNANGYGFQNYLIDVEPWTLPDWKQNYTLYLQRYINLTQTLHSYLNSQGIGFAAFVPYWLGPFLQNVTSRGFNALQVDELVVATYKPNYTDIYTVTQQLLGQITAPIVPAPNITPNSGDPWITYSDFNTLVQLDRNLNNSSPNLVGVAAYQSQALPPVSPSGATAGGACRCMPL